MSSQKRVQKPHSERTVEDEQQPPSPKENPEVEALKEYSDDLLDEIDGLLEENAAEFVANYQQKGGE